MSVRARSAAVAVLAIAVLVLIPGIASAHAERSVGPFDLEIGFLGEPAYVGVPNAVFLDLSTRRRAGHRPRRRSDRDRRFRRPDIRPVPLRAARGAGSVSGAVRPVPGRGVHVHAVRHARGRRVRSLPDVGARRRSMRCKTSPARRSRRSMRRRTRTSLRASRGNRIARPKRSPPRRRRRRRRSRTPPTARRRSASSASSSAPIGLVVGIVAFTVARKRA